MRLLALAIATLVSISSLDPSEGFSWPITSVLDLDRMLLKDKELAPSNDPEYFVAGGKPHRYAAFAPEFLVALHTMHLESARNSSSHLMRIFSGGARERNLDVLSTPLTASMMVGDLISDVFSFDDLVPAAPLPQGKKATDLMREIQQKGGQDKVPFFSMFKKDLALFSKQNPGDKVDSVILFDDNVNATPASQIRNILVVARPDKLDEDLVRPDSKLKHAPYARPRRRDPVQVARARYRLVRAIGLLDFAREAVLEGRYETIPDALDDLQWKGTAKFQADFVNQPQIYDRGMILLRRAYRQQIMPHQPYIVRSDNYFEIKPVTPRAEDCGTAMLQSTRAFLPWRL